MSSPTSTGSSRALWWVLGVALVAALVVLLITVVSPGRASSPATAPASEGGAEADIAEEPLLPDVSRRIEGDPAALGDIDAPVVLIEFADFRCPFCGVFARETLPDIVSDYVDDGLVRVEWRDVPIFGDDSLAAAVAARAAGEQDLFWEYSAAIYEYPGSDHQDLPKERLIELAEEIGIPDLSAFEAALEDPELAKLVRDDAREAEFLGVQSTPIFFVGGTPLMGAQPYEAFQSAIDTELKRVGA